MPDLLPPDLPRLQHIARWLELQKTQVDTIGTYIDVQLDAVYSKIQAVQDAQPRPGYVLQHIPARGGGTQPGRGILHAEGCPLLDDVPGEYALRFDERGARAAITDPEQITQPCEQCRPEQRLQRPTRA